DNTLDPSDNHMGVMVGNHLHTDPTLVQDVPKTTLDFKDGQVHSVAIDYRLNPARLEINLDNGLVTWTATINPPSRCDGAARK
ncbi:MAG: hypothetical protein IT323_08910, partial [Anaerolineae bacterium]|nr:hypothetical protein [Anaerolineae bacterium]